MVQQGVGLIDPLSPVHGLVRLVRASVADRAGMRSKPRLEEWAISLFGLVIASFR